MKKALVAAVKVLAGITIGLVVAEFGFRSRDDGAFPHLNLYLEDATLGVALEPNAETRVKLGKNPTTTVRTNSLGFRGGEWPAPAAGEVLVVGDSQVFGLGVEEGETFSAQLASLRNVNVVNAGVPTYGPNEYTTLVERLVTQRKPAHVVYVLNVSNDLFELGRPNTTRHRVWDGWAVRSETAPASVVSFPFRHSLMNRSHLIYAARRLLSSGGDVSQEAASEGTWKDVVSASSTTKPLVADDSAARQVLQERQTLTKQLAELQRGLDEHVSKKISDDEDFATGATKALPPLRQGDPRDIVQVEFLEGARDIDITANQLYRASLGAVGNEEKLLALAKQKNDADLVKFIEKRRELRGKVGPATGQHDAHEATPLEAMLLRTKKACDAVGAKLLVVALPLDVMVSDEEWKKYGHAPIDMELTSVLLDDIVSRAEAVEALGLNPTGALRLAEPGAFLDGDLHMTPKGHLALAKAIHSALDTKPKPKTELTLPEGRSWPPTPDEWLQVDEVNVKGSTAANCETREVREWFKMTCRSITDVPDADVLRLISIEPLEGGHGDVLLEANRTIMLPVLDGETVRIRVNWELHHQDLTIERPKGAAPKREFGEKVKHAKLKRKQVRDFDETGKPCSGRCDIEWHNPLRTVACDGGVVSGALRRCATSCDSTHACDAGTCQPWPSGDFCGAP